MRPNLPRGQAPAKGILHTEQRLPLRLTAQTNGKVGEFVSDPRGYWLGQHTNADKAPRRAMLAAIGRRQTLKRVKEQRRG